MTVAGELAALRGIARRLRTTAAPVEPRTCHAWASVLDSSARGLGREVEFLRAELGERLPEVDPDGGYEGLTLDQAAGRFASRAAALATGGAPAAYLLDERRRFTEHAVALSASLRSATARGVAATTPSADGPGTVAHGARATSADAARRLAKSGTQRRRVLDAVAAVARDPQVIGLTDRQIETATGLPANSVRPRRGELVDGGWLEPATDGDGQPVTREHLGRRWTVWVLTQRAAGTAELWGAHPGA